MKKAPNERAVTLGKYIILNKTTVRNAAFKFKISKSTVHKDVTTRLKYINFNLYKKVKLVLELNKSLRHIRGGLATKKKYLSFSKH